MSKSGFIILFSSIVLATACEKTTADDGKPASANKKTVQTKTGKFTQQQKLSYAMGVNIGIGLRRSIKQSKMDKDLNIRILMSGVQDSFRNKKLALSALEMQQVIKAYQIKQMALKRLEFSTLKKTHDNYFAKLKSQKILTSHKSGLFYKIIKPGTGLSPKATDVVQVHYSVVSMTGKLLFNSKQAGRLVTLIPQRSRVRVLKIAIPMMKKGAKWTIHVPAALAFGNAGRPPRIKPMQAFVFNIEIIAINPKAPTKKPKATTPTSKK